jgi:hypothetical protein
MARDIRVYRKKVFFYGEAMDKVLALAEDMGIEPEEVVRRAIHEYRIWVRQQREPERRRRRRPRPRLA